MPWQFSLVLAILFSTIAASMSFLITYGEYSRHQLLSHERVLQESLQTAAITWIFFAALVFAAGAWLPSIVQSSRP